MSTTTADGFVDNTPIDDSGWPVPTLAGPGTSTGGTEAGDIDFYASPGNRPQKPRGRRGGHNHAPALPRAAAANLAPPVAISVVTLAAMWVLASPDSNLVGALSAIVSGAGVFVLWTLSGPKRALVGAGLLVAAAGAYRLHHPLAVLVSALSIIASVLWARPMDEV